MVYDSIEEAQAAKRKSLELKDPVNPAVPREEEPEVELRQTHLAHKSANPDFYSVSEVMELLKLSRRHVLKKIRDGEIPAIAVARSYRIPRLELDRMVLESMDEDE